VKAFHDRVAVVTGAASGLGAALAEQAAALGMQLVIADIDAPALERMAGRLRDAGVPVLSQACDVADARPCRPWPMPRGSSVERRMQAILAQQAPADPFAFRPEILEGLKQRLALARSTS